MTARENAGRSVGADRGRKAKHSEKSNRSTSTEAQERRIIAALRRAPKTTDDLRALGVYQVSARIHHLRALDYGILTELFDGYAADGYSHRRMARYTLVSEPQGTQVRPPLRRPGKPRSGRSGAPGRAR